MFVGRRNELNVLKSRYGSGAFEFVGIYGRRRVGKTYLIGEFTKDMPCGYFTAVEDDPKANLRYLSQAIYLIDHPDADPDVAPNYQDYAAAVDAIFDIARTQRIVFVIDEFPYLAKAYPAFPSILQAAIDRNKDVSKLFLILCGSSLSFMKEQLLDKKSPLYGRKTAQIELKPFDVFDAWEFFPDAPVSMVAEFYGMVGGIPLYLQQLHAGLSLEENIAKAFLDPSSILYDEPLNLIKQEVSKAALYNAVISAIAGGASQHNQIATAAGIEPAALDYYLKELVRIGLIEKETPILGDAKAVWRITDCLFRFWYRFVRPRQSLIERGLGQRVAGKIVEAYPNHMGPVFESICRDWLWREYAGGGLDVELTNIGRWWGNDPIEREQAEIDVVAIDDKTTVLVGECKWRSELTDASVLSVLDRRAALIGADSRAPRYLFSKSGFTNGCKELADVMGNVRLVELDEL